MAAVRRGESMLQKATGSQVTRTAKRWSQRARVAWSQEIVGLGRGAAVSGVCNRRAAGSGSKLAIRVGLAWGVRGR